MTPLDCLLLLPNRSWQFPRQSTPWPSDGLRRASVNSFGYGGANVHVVLDDAGHYLETRNLPGKHATVLSSKESAGSLASRQCVSEALKSMEADVEWKVQPREPNPCLLVWSASDEASLKKLLKLFQQHLSSLCSDAEQKQCFESLCYTLSCRRSMLPWKTFLVCNSLLELENMMSLKGLELHRSRSIPVLSFVFTGQGVQWSGMGGELLGHHVFRTSLEQASVYLQELGCTWSLTGVNFVSCLFSLNLLMCSRGVASKQPRDQRPSGQLLPTNLYRIAGRFD